MNLNTLHNSILYKIVSLYLKANSFKAQVYGPITPQTQSDLYYKALTFRRDHSISRAPYLYEDAQLEIEKELNIDDRSYHFVVQRNQEIMGYIRLTPMPFEVSSLLPKSSFSVSEYPNYFEFSRFVTSTHATQKRYYALLLLLKAGQWLFADVKAQGILGICKPNRLQYFKNFNLLPQNSEPLSIANRISGYHLILGNKQAVLNAISKMLLKKLSLTNNTGKNYELRTAKKHS